MVYTLCAYYEDEDDVYVDVEADNDEEAIRLAQNKVSMDEGFLTLEIVGVESEYDEEEPQ